METPAALQEETLPARTRALHAPQAVQEETQPCNLHPLRRHIGARQPAWPCAAAPRAASLPPGPEHRNPNPGTRIGTGSAPAAASGGNPCHASGGNPASAHPRPARASGGSGGNSSMQFAPAWGAPTLLATRCGAPPRPPQNRNPNRGTRIGCGPMAPRLLQTVTPPCTSHLLRKPSRVSTASSLTVRAHGKERRTSLQEEPSAVCSTTISSDQLAS